MKLSTDSAERKNTPIFSGVLNYFPLALAYVAKVSKAGNDKHNPGQPLHWARDKSTDHQDCIVRHLIDYDGIDPDDGLLHAGKLAWRALALLETELEKRREVFVAPNDWVPPRPNPVDYQHPHDYYVALGRWKAANGGLVGDAGEEVGGQPTPEDAKYRPDRRDGPQ